MNLERASNIEPNDHQQPNAPSGIEYYTALGIGMYAVSMGASPRHDLAANYAKMIIESGQYAEKGAKLSMEKGWLEEPPQIINRDRLADMKN